MGIQSLEGMPTRVSVLCVCVCVCVSMQLLFLINEHNSEVKIIAGSS